MIPHVKTAIDLALKRKQVAAGSIERSRRNHAIANKAGLFGYHQSADSQLTTTIRMADGSRPQKAMVWVVSEICVDGKTATACFRADPAAT
jgi:hypothetical protein